MDDILKITRKSSDSIEVSYWDDDNNQALNITGGTIYFTAKKKIDDADNNPNTIQKIVTTHSNPTGGESIIELVPSDTATKKLGAYLYDVLLITADGKRIPSKRLKMELEQEVTAGP